MRGYIANTDAHWYAFLRDRQPLDEVNFWQPMGGRGFKVLSPGEPVYFKLKKPHYAIAGFGIFARHDNLPWWLAWEAFEQGNGAATREEMRARIVKYRKSNAASPDAPMDVGCIILVQPVFFDEADWVRGPSDWQPNIVSGKGYDLEAGDGRRIWEECQAAAARTRARRGMRDEGLGRGLLVAEEGARYGAPRPVAPRLGQGAFRIAVTQAYGGACAITREHSLPVIEAAHVRPYGEGGSHAVPNGIALRSDIHRLFDRGYVTFDEELRFVVSGRLREEFENGEEYYRRRGTRMFEPEAVGDRVDRGELAWHRERVFVG